MEKILRAILVDDEPLCTTGLEVDLNAVCPEIEVIAKCNSAKAAMKEIKELKPDVVFLDIEMPWMNGFELLNILAPIFFKIIFVTAYDEFAVRAFRVQAIDYIMKPIDRSLLRAAVERVINTQSDVYLQKIERLLQNVDRGATSKKISLPNSDGIDILNIGDIVYCEAQGNYTDVFLSDGSKKLVCKVLKEMEMSLPQNNFIRTHQSFLINVDYINSLHKSDGGYLTMQDGKRLPISRAKKSSILEYLKRL